MISIIAAVACGGVIGGGNSLLWHISEDLKRFKAITSGHPVIMGRKTFQSLGRPLPNRTNVVVTRDSSFAAEGCIKAGSLTEAIEMFAPEQEIFIIGGGQIYSQAMPLADKLYVTYVDARFDGDTYFPEVDDNVWRKTLSEPHPHGEKFPHPFEFTEWERK